MKKIKAKNTIMKDNSTIVYIVANKEYTLYAEFLTEKMFSGKCYVVLCEDGNFHGLDSDYFEK